MCLFLMTTSIAIIVTIPEYIERTQKLSNMIKTTEFQTKRPFELELRIEKTCCFLIEQTKKRKTAKTDILKGAPNQGSTLQAGDKKNQKVKIKFLFDFMD